MTGNGRRILVVDDEVKIVEVVKSYLEHSGYEVYECLQRSSGIKHI
jgi:DNA-binding response OmpR family regulator